MIDPYEISVIQSNGITSPDVLRVEVGDHDVLDDDIGRAADDPQSLADNNTAAALTDKRLVAPHSDAQDASLVVRDRDLGCVRLVVCAPSILVDGCLAGGASAPGSTAGAAHGTLAPSEVEGLREDDDTRGAVAEI